MNMSFYAGEEKYITATVTPVNPDELVVITSAIYELTDKDGKVVESGVCTVSDNEISVLLGISKVGAYTLKITVRVGRETIIEKVSIFAGG